MKKFIIASILMCMTVVIKAQIPFSVYTPVQTDPRTGYPIQQQQVQQRDHFQTVNAYYINNRGAFQKIRIKVNVVSGPLGGEQVYVRAYRDLTYSMWHDINNRATEVNQYSNDAAVIKENFDYKCYILNIGTVYF